MPIWPKLSLALAGLLLLDLAILSHRRRGRAYDWLQPLHRRYSRILCCTAIRAERFWFLRKACLVLFLLGLPFLRGLWLGLCWLLFILPEVWLLTAYSVRSKDRHREIRFLKRLFILNGSVEPTCFSEVLAILQDHAVYLEETLLLIRQERDRNSADLLQVYQGLDRQVEDLELRLFLEKLSQADRIHFSEGVRSMQTDLNIGRLIRQREARRRKEQIELAGIFLGLTLAGLLTYAMLLPWLRGSAFLLPT